MLAPLHLAVGNGKHLNCIGDHQCIKLTSDDTGGAFALMEDTNAPGFGIPIHYHTREDETFVILEGEVRFTVGHEVILARVGDTVFAPRMIQHSWFVVGERPAKMLTLITPGGLERMFEELSALGCPPDMAEVQRICATHGVHFVPASGTT